VTESSLPKEPDYLVPVNMERVREGYADLLTTFQVTKKIHRLELREKFQLEPQTLAAIEKSHKSVEETLDDVLYWDENKNLIYVEAIAVFKDSSDFVRFRTDLPTRLQITKIACPVCRCREWIPKNVDVKSVRDKKGRIWKCFSIIFVCKTCLEKGHITERAIRIQGIKYALIKIGRGLKDFLDRVEEVEIKGDLKNQTGSATIKVGQQRVELKRCPLL
jgi:hypothetical protein